MAYEWILMDIDGILMDIYMDTYGYERILMVTNGY